MSYRKSKLKLESVSDAVKQGMILEYRYRIFFNLTSILYSVVHVNPTSIISGVGQGDSHPGIDYSFINFNNIMDMKKESNSLFLDEKENDFLYRLYELERKLYDGNKFINIKVLNKNKNGISEDLEFKLSELVYISHNIMSDIYTHTGMLLSKMLQIDRCNTKNVIIDLFDVSMAEYNYLLSFKSTMSKEAILKLKSCNTKLQTMQKIFLSDAESIVENYRLVNTIVVQSYICQLRYALIYSGIISKKYIKNQILFKTHLDNFITEYYHYYSTYEHKQIDDHLLIAFINKFTFVIYMLDSNFRNDVYNITTAIFSGILSKKLYKYNISSNDFNTYYLICLEILYFFNIYKKQLDEYLAVDEELNILTENFSRVKSIGNKTILDCNDFTELSKKIKKVRIILNSKRKIKTQFLDAINNLEYNIKKQQIKVKLLHSNCALIFKFISFINLGVNQSPRHNQI